MGSYEVEWKKSAAGDLHRIDRQFIGRIIRAVETLKNHPFPQQSKKLRGAEHIYRLRVGDYRVVYGIDAAAKILTIYHVRHRKDIYRRGAR